MFEDVVVPKKLENSPIVKSVFEIRFDSDLEKDEFYSCMHSLLRKKLNTAGVELPFNKIPDFIKDGDMYMKYQPCYKFQDENFVVQFGPHVIIFSCIAPYTSWTDWSSKISSVLKSQESEAFASHLFVERIGLRYIDVIEGSVEDNCNVSYLLGEKKYEFSNKKTRFRVELPVGDSIAIIKIENAQKQDSSFNSSIDIDFIQKYSRLNFETYMANEFAKLVDIHETSKKFFFGILNESCVNKLGAQY